MLTKSTPATVIMATILHTYTQPPPPPSSTQPMPQLARPAALNTKDDLIDTLRYYSQQFANITAADSPLPSPTTTPPPITVQQLDHTVTLASHTTTKWMLMLPNNNADDIDILIHTSKDMFTNHDKLITLIRHLTTYGGRHMRHTISAAVNAIATDMYRLTDMVLHGKVTAAQCHLLLERLTSCSQLPLSNAVCVARRVATHIKYIKDTLEQLNEMLEHGGDSNSSSESDSGDDDEPHNTLTDSTDFDDHVDARVLPAVTHIHTIDITLYAVVRTIYLFLIKTKFSTDTQTTLFLDTMCSEIDSLTSLNDNVVSELTISDSMQPVVPAVHQLVKQLVRVINTAAKNTVFQDKFTSLSDAHLKDLPIGNDMTAVMQCDICNEVQQLPSTAPLELLRWYNNATASLHQAHTAIHT